MMHITPQLIDGLIKGMAPMYVHLKKSDLEKYNITIKKFQEEAREDPNSALNEGMFVPRYGGYPRYFFVEMLKALGEPLEPSP